MANENLTDLPDIQMDVAPLLERCRRRGIRLYVKNGELGYRAAKGSMSEDILAAVRTRKSDILHHLARLEESRFRIIAACANRAPLFNRFLWKDYSNRVMEAGGANAVHIVMRCNGEILTGPLLRSIEILHERHDVLNSSVETAVGNLHLVRRAPKSAAFHEVAVTGKTAGEREDAAYLVANNLIWEEYDLDDGPLYRIFLIRLSAVGYVLGAALHHAIGDLLSIGILFHELISIYGSVAAGIPLRLSPVRFSYMDYLASMESWSTAPACLDHLRYWKDKLKSTPVTDLPADGKRHLDGTITGATAETKFLLDSGISGDLKKIAVQLKTTLFTVLLAIYKIALWRINGHEEPVVIALHAGRFDAGFQNTIGDFALEVAYKTCLAGDPDFAEVVRRVIHTVNEANSHQPIPLDWIRRALAEDGIPFCAPGMNFISGDAGHAMNPLEPRQLKFTPPGVRHGCHGFPASFAIEFRDSGGVIEGSIAYRNDLYDESAISAFINCFIRTTLNLSL